MDSTYSELTRAQLSFEYLHTNSTTHEFLFGALAELLDNSRDADATFVKIFTVPHEESRGSFLLCFLDDGEGMSPSECSDIVTFGKSVKRSLDGEHIGMYGNGLKSGSMRIGNDLILFTKKRQTKSTTASVSAADSVASRTCLFLSRTFHETEGIDEVVVPLPSFQIDSRQALGCGSDQDTVGGGGGAAGSTGGNSSASSSSRHKQEMDIILKYSPFKTEDQFFEQFDKIQSDHGTLVIVYNVKLLDSGSPELDILSDQHDIRTAPLDSEEYDTNEDLVAERTSFRAYSAILYKNPKMKIYIQSVKVRTRRLEVCLYRPRQYVYVSSRFRTRSEKEAKSAAEDAKKVEMKLREAQSRAAHFEKQLAERYAPAVSNPSPSGVGQLAPREERITLRKLRDRAAQLRTEVELRKRIAERKQKLLKEPKELHFYFGVNITNRRQDGLFVYNSGRLIRMYERPLTNTIQGVVGLVDVPYAVLEPTHNKQDFADAKEYRHLKKAMDDHLVQYWRDVDIASKGVAEFWRDYGYLSASNWTLPPSDDPKFAKKRFLQLQHCVQCDKCRKWRFLPGQPSMMGRQFPETWCCADNPDKQFSRCSAPEQAPRIPTGELRKVVKSAEERQRDLQQKVARHQAELDRLQQQTTTDSSQSPRHQQQQQQQTSSPYVDHQPIAVRSTPITMAGIGSENESVAAASEARSRVQARLVQPSVVVNRVSAASVTLPQSSGGGVSAREPRSAKLLADSRISRMGVTASSSSEPTATASGAVSSASALSSHRRKATPVHLHQKRRRLVQVCSSSEDEEEVEEEEEHEDKAALENDEDDHGYRAAHRLNIRSSPGRRSTVRAITGPTLAQPGSAVSAQLHNEWQRGRIIKIDRRRGWLIKFDKFPSAKFDQWFEPAGNRVRLIVSAAAAVAASASGNRPSNQASSDVVVGGGKSSSNALLNSIGHSQSASRSNVASTPANNTAAATNSRGSPSASKAATSTSSSSPSASSTTAPPPGVVSRRSRRAAAAGEVVGEEVEEEETKDNDIDTSKAAAAARLSRVSGVEAELTKLRSQSESVAKLFRDMIRFFIPPSWNMKKEAIDQLTVADLATFDLNSFLEQYEANLRDLIAGYSDAASQKESKLRELRSMIGRMLQAISDVTLDPNGDPEEVDSLFASCLSEIESGSQTEPPDDQHEPADGGS